MNSLENKVKEYEQRMTNNFDKWKNLEHHRSQVFVEDGVVCPEKWFASGIRPLFLLKEAYGGDHNWSLVNDYLVKDDPIERVWKTISLWTKGILKTTAEHIEPYEINDAEFSKFNNEYLKSIAVINVKKSKGVNTSDYNDILSYAKSDRSLLLEQLKICDPTIIICGYTIDPLIEIFGDIKKVHNENLYYYINLNEHNVLVLDYWHPANQFPKIMNYYGLVNIYQQALLNKN